MTDPLDTAFSEQPLPATAVPAPPRSTSQWGRVRIVAAWVVILVLVTLIAVVQYLSEGRRDQITHEDQEGKDPVGLVNAQLQGRYLVGMRTFLAGSGAAAQKEDVERQVETINTGPVDQRLRYVVLVGELVGAHRAVEEIDRLKQRMAKQQVEPTPTQTQLLHILHRLYADYGNLRLDAPGVTAAERDLLRKELGWFGDLALAPHGLPEAAPQALAAAAGGPAAVVATQAKTPDPKAREAALAPATRTFLTAFGAVGVVLLATGAGFVLLIVMGILWLRGGISGGLYLGTRRGSVYAETFALWLLLFMALQVAVVFAPDGWRLPAALGADLLSLTALGWPVLRGVPWRHLIYEVGLFPGRQPPLEPVYGVVGYLMMLPIILGVALVTFVLMALQKFLEGVGNPHDSFQPIGGPSHPAVELVVFGDVWQRILVFVLAAVMAPLIEEIMFRGVLYRHLRELSAGWQRWLSVVFSAVVMSFLFAVIHPQGLALVPVLMTLSFALTLVREWRVTLVPGMVAHGLHNGFICAFTMLAIGS